MNIQSIIVLVLVLVATGIAIWICIRNKKNGTSCCGGTCCSCKNGCQTSGKDFKIKQ